MNRSFKLSFTHHIEYDIQRTSKIFNSENEILADQIGNKKVYCLIDKNVECYIKELKLYFDIQRIEAYFFVMSPSEQQKNINSVTEFTSFCFQNEIGRRDVILALGGGVICDLGGLSANLIRRGTPLIKIPTTLLAVIDAAVGVKTGVNFSDCKNSLGTYYAPNAVLIDLQLLESLPKTEIKNGLVEMMKILSLKDKSSWEMLKINLANFYLNNLTKDVIELIDKSIQYMLEELSSNLFEKELNRIVDYGHEFGHIIENLTHYSLSHGQAVGIGMLLSNLIARNKGLMDEGDFEDFKSVFSTLQFAYWHPLLSPEALFAKIGTITRHKDGNFSIVALKKIGQPIFINSITFSEIYDATDSLKLLDAQHRLVSINV